MRLPWVRKGMHVEEMNMTSHRICGTKTTDRPRRNRAPRVWNTTASNMDSLQRQIAVWAAYVLASLMSVSAAADPPVVSQVSQSPPNSVPTSTPLVTYSFSIDAPIASQLPGYIVILFEIRTLRPYRYYYISIFINWLQLL
jgi:hypothetical protein